MEEEAALVHYRDLRCVICLELFDWPITLPCGHTFCRACIAASWAAQRRSPAHACCTCPVCRKEYPRKRRLAKTVVLANMVEEVKRRRRRVVARGGGGGDDGDDDAAAAAVSCKSCLGEDVLAVKTCLRCESALCEAHVKLHRHDPAFSGHVLAPLGINVAARRCTEHGATLRYYCTREGLLVCSDCSLFGTHKNHQLVAAKDEYEERKLLVTMEREGRIDRKKNSESKVHELTAFHDRVERYTDAIKTRVSAFYAVSKPAAAAAADDDEEEEEEDEVVRGLDAQCGPVLYSTQLAIERHRKEIEALGCIISRLEALLETHDPIAFLQDPVLNELTNVPAKVHTKGLLLSTTTDLDKIISLQKIMGTRPLPLIAERYGCSPTLDPATASPWLRVSRDLKTVMGSPPRQPPPDHPERFDCWHPQVLGARPLASGRHYWEVDVGGAGSWRVGVAYGSVPRKGQGGVCKLGENGDSWCLFMDNSELTARHGGVGTLLLLLRRRPNPLQQQQQQQQGDAGEIPAAPAAAAPAAAPVAAPAPAAPAAALAPAPAPGAAVRKVGVFLDCDAGVLSFYLADDMTLLHTFHAKFTQPLFPALAVLVWDGSLSMVELE
ncbi:tripartite motif-containing protein 14-like [Petromyzon marinus]|uniref:tripartite motif-containing protein 14-like n=1 Tax=Petromyzon marinus TaxID=7757 RepID=UPI003F6E5C05